MLKLGHQTIALELIVPSKTNPRKSFAENALQELARDIADKGVLQSIIVRPLPGGLPLCEGKLYEVVAGERRFRASILAGRADIPADVRDLNDQQALEIQMVENIQRSDLDPIEEADGYQAMLDFRDETGKAVYTVDMLAEKIRKDKTYIYRRMTLRKLPSVARQAVLSGALPVATATLIARIPSEDLRKAAAEEILKPDFQDQPLSRDKAQELINARYMRELKGAPFDPRDKTLHPRMGACDDCPLRTGNAPEIYGDVKRGDICTNPGCFTRKADTAWARLQSAAQDEGKRVLNEEETAKVFPNQDRSLAWNTPYVDIKVQPIATDLAPGTKHPPSWQKLIAKSPCKVEVVLARDPAGNIRELALREQVTEAARQAAIANNKPDILVAPRGKSPDDKLLKEANRQLREQQKRDRLITEFTVAAVIEAIENRTEIIPPYFLAGLLPAAIRHAGYVGCKQVAIRRNEGEPSKSAQEWLEEYAAQLVPREMGGLVCELFFADSVAAAGKESALLQVWVKITDVDVEAIIQQVTEATNSKPTKTKTKGKN